jgi:hypothetical protein
MIKYISIFKYDVTSLFLAQIHFITSHEIKNVVSLTFDFFGFEIIYKNIVKILHNNDN